MAELSIQKRRSGTISGAERITGVKNAQSEMILARRLQQYNQNYRKAKLVNYLKTALLQKKNHIHIIN